MDETADKKSLFLSPEISDFVIIIGDQRLNVEKSVLMSSSVYFSALFNSQMIETQIKEITLKDTLINPFLIILKLCYNIEMSAEEWNQLKIKDICESIITADKYQFIDFEVQLSNKLIEILSYKLSKPKDLLRRNETTIWSVLEMSKLYKFIHLYDLCLKFIDENVSYALTTFDSQVESRLLVYSDILLDVIRRDSFGALEMEVLKLVKKWVQKYKILLKGLFDENLLLESIRLNLIPRRDLPIVMSSGLYEPEVIERKVRNLLNGSLKASNKRISIESGKLFKPIEFRETYLKFKEKELISICCVLRMPSKINRLMFNIKPIKSSLKPNTKYYANYLIERADIALEETYFYCTFEPKEGTKIFEKNYCELGEQDIHFDEPFIAESLRIVVELYWLRDGHRPRELFRRQSYFSKPYWNDIFPPLPEIQFSPQVSKNMPNDMLSSQFISIEDVKHELIKH